MPKTTSDFDPETYAPVAARVELFYERYPNGRILTELVERTEQEIVFRAAVYRAAEDREPAATGWAAERIGDGEVNAVACLENTETSAIGRALANLGFLASRLRPSAEEVAKADRARARLAGEPDVLQLLRTAERAGLSATRRRRCGRAWGAGSRRRSWPRCSTSSGGSSSDGWRTTRRGRGGGSEGVGGGVSQCRCLNA